MSPQSASNAAGLILLPFILVSTMQFCRWLMGWLTDWLIPCLAGWLA